MQLTYTDTDTDRRGHTLFHKMVNSPDWTQIRSKPVHRQLSTAFIIGFDMILRKVSDPSKFIFLKYRESNEGKTVTYTFKEQKTTHYREPA